MMNIFVARRAEKLKFVFTAKLVSIKQQDPDQDQDATEQHHQD